jgi:molybdopterin-binding protein
MKLSARNAIKGKIVPVREAPVTAIVPLDIGGGRQVVSSTAMDSAKNLRLAAGKDATAIVKASTVMLAVD